MATDTSMMRYLMPPASVNPRCTDPGQRCLVALGALPHRINARKRRNHRVVLEHLAMAEGFGGGKAKFSRRACAVFLPRLSIGHGRPSHAARKIPSTPDPDQLPRRSSQEPHEQPSHQLTSPGSNTS